MWALRCNPHQDMGNDSVHNESDVTLTSCVPDDQFDVCGLLPEYSSPSSSQLANKKTPKILLVVKSKSRRERQASKLREDRDSWFPHFCLIMEHLIIWVLCYDMSVVHVY
jgi:hypothetical protein